MGTSVQISAFFDELDKIASIAAEQVRRGTPVAGSFDAFQRGLRRGDVIFTKPSEEGRKSSLSPVVNLYDKATGAKHPGWIHAAVYLGDGRIGHLDEKKLKRNRITGQPPKIGEDSVGLFEKTKYDLVALRPRSKAVAGRAASRMQELADAGQGITAGKYVRNLLRTGLNMPGRSVTDAVCTGVVGEAFRDARLSKRDPLAMRPKDFLESSKLRHALSYSRDGGRHG